MSEETIDVAAELEFIRSGGATPEPAATPAPAPTPAPATETDDAAEATPTTPAPQAEQQAPTQETNPQDANWNPEGPGDRRVALKHAREALNVAKQAAEAEKARADAAERRLAEIEQAKQKAAQDAALQATLDNMHPDDIPGYLESLRQQDSERVQTEYQQQRIVDRAQASLELARETYPDFEAQIAKLNNLPAVDWTYFDAQPNPAKAAYDFAKTLPTPDDFESRVQSEVDRRLAELAPKTQPQPPRAPRGLASIPAAATASATPRDPVYDVSEEDLAKMSASERREWMEKALAPRQ